MSKEIVKKGIVLANMITHKKGGYIYKGKDVTSNDVNNFEEAVKNGTIEVDEKSIAKFKEHQEKIAKEAQKAEKERIDRAKAADELKANAVTALADSNKKVETLTEELATEKANAVTALAEKDGVITKLNLEITDLKTKLKK